MLFVSGVTRCPACGGPLDDTDDTIPVAPWEAPAQDWVGFYHRECLAMLPWWAEAVARWRGYNEAQLRSRAKSTTVLGRNDRYALVYGAADRVIELFYLQHMARQRFPDPGGWAAFVGFVTGVAEGESYRENKAGAFESPNKQYSARIVPPDRVVLGWGEAVRREIDFAREEYDAYVAQHGELTGFVEFPELAERGLLRPTAVDGELAKNRGVVVEVKPVKNVYVVSFDAPRMVRLGLSREEFADLAKFLAGVKLGH
jgi:hypothetical protein